MLRKIEKSAKNINDALALAAEELGVAPEELSYEVTREVGKGLMKLLVGTEVEIVAWVTKEAEAEEAKKPKKEEPKKAVKKEETKKEAAEEKKSKSEPRADFVIPKESVDDAKMFLGEMLKKIGFDAKLSVRLDGNTIYIDVSGDKMGLLIGKRGDTLDAVQYLTSLYVNKGKGQYIKVSVDTENYRAKREETLVRLARGLQRRVIKERKDITLEPMSPNERRIIHATLQHDKRITTYSVGEEPNRRLVVAYAKRDNEE
ncbi:MAG: protein jag [Clostridia bacterium]|nr:protein jag [Clostridia bacterium]